MIKLDLSYAKLDEDLDSYQEKVSEAHKWLHEKTGKGSDYVGWVEWPNTYDKEEFARILALSEKLKGRYDILLVCGIGGSYLGTRAAVEMIRGLFPCEGPEVIFVGNTFSHTYISRHTKCHLQIGHYDRNGPGIQDLQTVHRGKIRQGRSQRKDHCHYR